MQYPELDYGSLIRFFKKKEGELFPLFCRVVAEPAARMRVRVGASFRVGGEAGQQLGAAQHIEAAGNIDRNTIDRHSNTSMRRHPFVVRPSQCLYDTIDGGSCQDPELDYPSLTL